MGYTKLEEWFRGACANYKKQDKSELYNIQDPDFEKFVAFLKPFKKAYETIKRRRTNIPVLYKFVDGRKRQAIEVTNNK